MDILIQQGIIGIITGILTTAILFTLKVFWTAKVTPFLASIRYQGVIVSGQWSGFAEVTEKEIEEKKLEGTPFKSEHSLFLNQNAHNLTGSLLFKFSNPEKKFSIDFNVNGYMWEGYITLNFTPKDKRVTSYATALLKLHDGGHTLVGSWLFRDVIKENVLQTSMFLSRQEQ
ncbi:hypothetical protein [Sulfurimonas sp.]|uniref:hypothetical protein n=1 Tax=Sulfurimonas sp. TaxID=2022749 RepID=UPI00286E65A5|nr:hypothetical protein [Sulfurimonas sp.]